MIIMVITVITGGAWWQQATAQWCGWHTATITAAAAYAGFIVLYIVIIYHIRLIIIIRLRVIKIIFVVITVKVTARCNN